MMVIDMLQYLDKNSINIASVYGLKKNLNLEGQDCSWVGNRVTKGWSADEISDYVLCGLSHLPMPSGVSPSEIVYGEVFSFHNHSMRNNSHAYHDV